MKTFSLSVKCETELELRGALVFAIACIDSDPGRVDEMAVDDQDEQLTEPESILQRIA